MVEVAPKAVPPVAKVVDFKKFLYQEEKKTREEKRKTKKPETKELRFRPFINAHDLLVMTTRGKKFLEEGNKVRVVVNFRGRQITHPEFGHELIDRVIDTLSGVSKVDREKHFEGPNLIAILSPEKRKNKNVQEEDKKVSK